MDKRTLNGLMALVRRGDENAFADLFEGAKKGVFSFIYSYVKNYHTAEDLVQETFIKVRQKTDLYQDGTNASAWILQIAKNTALDFLRKDGKNKSVELDENTSFNSPDENVRLDLHDIINAVLNGEERQVVLLHLIGGYKNREIAEILNIPLGTALWKYNVAIKKLKEKLKEVGYAE